MNDKEIERTNLIDRYINGQMTHEEMSDFKKHLEEDAALRAELENYEISRKAIKNYGLRNELKSIRSAMLQEEVAHETTARPEAKTVPIWKYSLRIAATILLIMVSFLAVQVATLSGENLYEDKAFPYELTTSRNGNEVVDSQNQVIQQSYASGNFQEAVRQYEALSNPSVTATFIAGNAYLQSDQPEKAITAFQKVLTMNEQQNENLFKDDAAYYLALSHLRAENYDQAFTRFQEIKTSDSSYKQYVGNYFLIKLKILNWID